MFLASSNRFLILIKMKRAFFNIFKRNYGNLLSIEGNIASGKTSLLNDLKKYLPQCFIHEEPVHKWRNLGGTNIFDLMYKDTKRWGFLFQSYVQLTMFVTHQAALDNDQSIHILERSIFSARYCFVENFIKSNLITDVECGVIDGWFKFLTEKDRCPLNFMVYLRTTPEVVYERVLQRARPEENVVGLQYLKELHERHEEWLIPEEHRLTNIPSGSVIQKSSALMPHCPVLVIDSSLPWKQLQEQIRDVVVPVIQGRAITLQQSSQHLR